MAAIIDMWCRGEAEIVGWRLAGDAARLMSPEEDTKSDPAGGEGRVLRRVG